MEKTIDESELVTVARFTEPAEAQMARGALEAAGIEVVVQGENASNLYPGALTTQLLVAPADEAEARELLASDGTREATAEERESER